MSKKINDHLDVTPEAVDQLKSINEVISLYRKHQYPQYLYLLLWQSDSHYYQSDQVSDKPGTVHSKINARSVLLYEDSTTFVALIFWSSSALEL